MKRSHLCLPAALLEFGARLKGWSYLYRDPGVSSSVTWRRLIVRWVLWLWKPWRDVLFKKTQQCKESRVYFIITLAFREIRWNDRMPVSILNLTRWTMTTSSLESNKKRPWGDVMEKYTYRKECQMIRNLLIKCELILEPLILSRFLAWIYKRHTGSVSLISVEPLHCPANNSWPPHPSHRTFPFPCKWA